MSQPPRRPEREAEHGRRDAERDDVGERVEIGAEHRLPLAVEARDVAVEHVAHQRERQQQERRPEEPAVVGGEVVEAQEDGDGAARRVADGQRVGRGVGPQHRQVAALCAHSCYSGPQPMSARDQAGVIPFRRKRDGIEICLIRNKGRKKWKIPKGFVDPGETAQQAALKEAWEEAGLARPHRWRRDRVVRGTGKWNLELTVAVFLMEVRTEEDEWEESHFRERRWALLDEAFAWLTGHPVKSLLADAAAKLGRKRRKA